jgi:hypothetical protein
LETEGELAEENILEADRVLNIDSIGRLMVNLRPLYQQKELVSKCSFLYFKRVIILELNLKKNYYLRVGARRLCNIFLYCLIFILAHRLQNMNKCV